MTINSAGIVSTASLPLTVYNEFVSWTPTVSGTTTAGTGTYTLQFGRYTKIGAMVFINANISWTAHTGTGNLLLSSLPFTVRNTTNYVPLATVNFININLPAGTQGALGQFTLNTTNMSLFSYRDVNTNSQVAMDTAGQIQVSGWYIT